VAAHFCNISTWKLRQKDHEFEANLGYTAVPGYLGLNWEPSLKQINNPLKQIENTLKQTNKTLTLALKMTLECTMLGSFLTFSIFLESSVQILLGYLGISPMPL
jgi:hypothetical protein